jgi:hypothetical protein
MEEVKAPRKVSERAQIANTITFSDKLALCSTKRQLRAYALQQADRIIAQGRKQATTPCPA